MFEWMSDWLKQTGLSFVRLYWFQFVLWYLRESVTWSDWVYSRLFLSVKWYWRESLS